jgi:hypothetical protein
MRNNSFPPKLHVLLAREAGRAIVIRRGPSSQTSVFAWDRETNLFQIAHWFKGRIYERRSDISPDGKFWIYFAMNGKWQAETSGSWTTVARTPQLKAISLYAKGNCWNGGGLFLSNRTFWLNDGLGHVPLFESDRVHRSHHYHPPFHYGRECPHVYYNRLQRDGWRPAQRETVSDTVTRVLFDKNVSENRILRKVCVEEIASPHSRGRFFDEHLLIHGDAIIAHNDWEWAEVVADTILYCASGCLFQQRFQNEDVPDAPELLHDFNAYSFQKRISPARRTQTGTDDTISI